MKRSLQILMLVVVAFAGGVHLTTLQVVAWAGMIAGDTGQYGFSAAIERTFDGEHPCGLCEFVDAVSESSSDDPMQDRENRVSLDLKLIPLDELAFETPSDSHIPHDLVSWDRILTGRDEIPGVPPPRLA